MNLAALNEVKCDSPGLWSGEATCTMGWGKCPPQNQAEEGRGMAWEYIIALVNQMDGANLWIPVILPIKTVGVMETSASSYYQNHGSGKQCKEDRYPPAVQSRNEREFEIIGFRGDQVVSVAAL